MNYPFSRREQISKKKCKSLSMSHAARAHVKWALSETASTHHSWARGTHFYACLGRKLQLSNYVEHNAASRYFTYIIHYKLPYPLRVCENLYTHCLSLLPYSPGWYIITISIKVFHHIYQRSRKSLFSLSPLSGKEDACPQHRIRQTVTSPLLCNTKQKEALLVFKAMVKGSSTQ